MSQFGGLAALAPAKVNLFLHVGAPEPSGYHPVSSLVVFADVGDRVSIAPADRFDLEIEGPFAAELGSDPDNLIARAARAFAEAAEVGADARFRLDKQLPIASGVGGGSADAGAALRLLRAALAPDLAEEALLVTAGKLGADGPMCLVSRPAIATGYGEVLQPAPELPELHAVLVNPRRPSPTGAVYRAYDAARAPSGAETPEPPHRALDFAGLVDWLQGTRNDLEPPAVVLEPAIGEVLSVLRAAPEAAFARMSGSGATCFALCPSEAAARGMAERLSRLQPRWWVAPCRLGGPWAEAEPHHPTRD